LASEGKALLSYFAIRRNRLLGFVTWQRRYTWISV